MEDREDGKQLLGLVGGQTKRDFFVNTVYVISQKLGNEFTLEELNESLVGMNVEPMPEEEFENLDLLGLLDI